MEDLLATPSMETKEKVMTPKNSFLELCEKAYQEYSRPQIIKPYLQEMAQCIDQEQWEKALTLLDELEELLDLDLSS